MYVAGLWSRSQPFFIFGQSRIVYSALVLAMRLKITEKKSLRKAIFNVQLISLWRLNLHGVECSAPCISATGASHTWLCNPSTLEECCGKGLLSVFRFNDTELTQTGIGQNWKGIE